MPDHKVRTTFRPGVEITVGDVELADLTAQGLLAPTAKTVSEGAPKTPVAAPAPGDNDKSKKEAK